MPHQLKTLAVQRKAFRDGATVEDRHQVRLRQVGRLRLARRRIVGIGARFAWDRREIVEFGSNEWKRFDFCFLQAYKLISPD
jgi:hypothetical protein